DLAALTRIHTLSGRLISKHEFEPFLQEVMHAAVAIVGADFGTLQLLEGDALRIVAHSGHRRPFLDFFAHAEARASACGAALTRGERVVVEDVEAADSIFAGSPSLKILRDAGVRAVQSTTMISRTGALLGILTTRGRSPYVPAPPHLCRIDLLARQAADTIETARAEQALKA